jgi:putative RecB family exonuclease
MKVYSHSKLSAFEQCPLKFKYRYIDKIIPKIEKSIETHLGKSVHDTLEWLYTNVKDKIISTLDEVIIYYSKAWKKDLSPEIRIINKELTSKDYFNKGIQFLIEYYTKHHPFDDGTIELEKKILLNLDENKEYQIIGYIDRLVKNLQTGEYEIHDYKTANNLPRQEDVDNDRQLALYAIAIKQLFGKEEEVCLVWHYLAHNKKITSKRTNEQLESLKKDTIALIEKIESTTEFNPCVGKLCQWCEYKDTCNALNPNLPEPTQETKEIKIDSEKYPTVSKYIKD